MTKRNTIILLLISFFVWLFAFRGFVRGELSLQSDATSYYDFFRYYIENLTRGVFPMWEPTRAGGVPIEFFLRRIGSFNPFILLIVIFDAIGFSYTTAYFLFLSTYYFVGMIGYFLIARHLFRSNALAFIAYLLLMFSSLGTRLFDSYIILTCVPMIWFFYFLITFFHEPKKHRLIGIVFCLMLLVTTYIPFYFVTIFITFLISYLIIYFRTLKTIFSRVSIFIKENKFLVILCLVITAVSLVPGVLIYKDMSKGEFVLPMRHYGSDSVNSMEVNINTITKWAMIEDITYSGYFANLKDFKFAVVYVPPLLYLLLILGFTAEITSLFLFLFIWGGINFLIASPDITNLYQYLYEHVFYFKYFRNLHFFLWMLILPVGILLLIEQFRQVLNFKLSSKFKKIALILFVSIAHALLLCFMIFEGGNIASSYIAIGLSALLFILYFLDKLKLESLPFIALLFLSIIVQPVEVYNYLQKNSLKQEKWYRYLDHDASWYRYRYYNEYSILRIPTAEEIDALRNKQNSDPESMTVFLREDPFRVYMAAKWYYFLMKTLDQKFFNSYQAWGPFRVYDYIEQIPDSEDIDLERIAFAFKNGRNVAFVVGDNIPYTNEKQSKLDNEYAQGISGDSQEVKVLHFDINQLRLKTNFPKRKFLVHNDAYHSRWHAYIDGNEVPLYRANVAFKGLWVPEGEHVVYLQFEKNWRHILNYFYLFLFFTIFISLIYFWIKSLECKDNAK